MLECLFIQVPAELQLKKLYIDMREVKQPSSVLKPFLLSDLILVESLRITNISSNDGLIFLAALAENTRLKKLKL